MELAELPDLVFFGGAALCRLYGEGLAEAGVPHDHVAPVRAVVGEAASLQRFHEIGEAHILRFPGQDAGK